MTDPPRRTRLLVLFGVIAYAAYDVWTYLRHGGESSISTIVGAWLSAPWYGWLVCVVLGGLAGHFVGMVEPQTPHYAGRIAVTLLAAVALYALTRGG